MTLAIIQARLGSTRLPRKTLMDIGGKPMIQHVVERVQQIRGVDVVVLAVPHGEAAFLPWAPIVVAPAVDEADVLGRFAAIVASHPDADPIMRISGDCPLLSPAICAQVLQLYQQTPGCHYAWNVARGYVDGEDCEVVSREALLCAHAWARGPFDREHVTPWVRRNVDVATLPATLRTGRREPPRKTSVDTLEDLERVRQLCQPPF